MEKIEQQIDKWSENLANRVSEMKLMDIDQLKVSISTYMKLALHDCLKIDISELEQKLNKKKIIYANFKGNSKFLQAEIISIKSKMKERNVMRSQMEQIEKLGMLIKYLNENHPDIIKPFYEDFKEHIDTYSSLSAGKNVFK